jgi:hypothetical protein
MLVYSFRLANERLPARSQWSASTRSDGLSVFVLMVVESDNWLASWE